MNGDYFFEVCIFVYSFCSKFYDIPTAHTPTTYATTLMNKACSLLYIQYLQGHDFSYGYLGLTMDYVHICEASPSQSNTQNCFG